MGFELLNYMWKGTLFSDNPLLIWGNCTLYLIDVYSMANLSFANCNSALSPPPKSLKETSL